jgi:hypothetical protein
MMPAERHFGSLGRALLLALVVGCSAGATATASVSARVAAYRGYAVRVPAGWPVFRLAARPHTCVRFNRHAVYLGRPGSQQRCPALAAGRTEAILVAPRGMRTGLGSGGRLMRFARKGVVVTATWAGHPGVVSRALGGVRVRPTPPVAHPASALPRPAQTAGASSVFTGLGFDACSAPSTASMQAWAPSYGAAGIYIGGANVACSQPNLTSTWVSEQISAGWHLIPTYVGLQAPSNSCGCAAISPAHATAEGSAAATDAIAQAQALGLGAGTPIYFDMEAYSSSSSTTAAVLAFLSAWTTQLHAEHYLSGVYSSSDSGIRDLANAFGTSFVEPDDLWIANWNNQQSTADPNVPANEFASHDRLHQYAGGHDETHGGVKIDIDSDYLDGAAAGGGSGALLTPAPAPALALSPQPNGTVRIRSSWLGMTGIASWRVLGGPTPTSLVQFGAPIASTGDADVTLHDQFSYFQAEAFDSSNVLLGMTAVTATPAHLALYGASAFVGAHGAGTLPAGCFTGRSCSVSTTITAGGEVIARTGGERVSSAGARVIHFQLTSAGRSKLARARGHRLAVRVVARDASGVAAAASMKLVPFEVSGHAPARSVSNAPSLQLLAATGFVFRRRTGGILAECTGVTVPCAVTMKLTDGRTTVATTNAQSIGANEVAYLRFALTGAGRALLARARGNQVGVRAELTDSTSHARASGRLALIGYS